MRIDSAKSPQLLAAIFSIALTASTVGCAGAFNKEGSVTRIPQIPVPSTVVPSQRCSISAEAIRPPSLSREHVATYLGGIVVNQAGDLADITVNATNLIRINSDPALGLSLPDHVNIVYFFQGSFSRPDAQIQINAFLNTQRDYLAARYCEEQQVVLNRFILTAISIRDAQDNLLRANPTLSPYSSLWIPALEKRIGTDYIIEARRSLERTSNQRPTQLPFEKVQQALDMGVPFQILRSVPLQNPI